MSEPAVTVGLPFYNHRHTILWTVQSVFAQTLRDWELLLIDDGSTDGTKSMLERISDPRVRMISDGANRGQTRRLNEIPILARGRYIVRMDADDIMHPSRLEVQLELLKSALNLDLVCSPAIAIDWRNRVLGRVGSFDLPRTRRGFLERTHIIHPTVMVRRDWALRFQYDERYAYSQDRELWARSSPHSRFASTVEPLVFYRVDNPNAVRNYRNHTRECTALLRSFVGDELTQREFWWLRAQMALKAVCFTGMTLIRFRMPRTVLRCQRLSSGQKSDFRRVLSLVFGTPLPGIDSTGLSSKLAICHPERD